MQELYYKYALLLLKKGLCITKKQPLVVNAPIEAIDFIRVLTDVACKMGIKDIYYDWYDDELKHTLLKYYNYKSIKSSSFWNKQIHDEYTKKNAAFLFLTSSNPNIMKDIDAKKLKTASKQSLKTRKTYRKLQSNNEVSWCIAAVATSAWGKLLFPDSLTPREDLWNLIFEICDIKEEDPLKVWKQTMNNNRKMCLKLTNMNIKSLHYTNSMGTDLTVELSKNAIWCGGASKINGKNPIVNIPTAEVFTTPNKYMTNGIVYASIPLISSGTVIKDICLEFKDGKVIRYSASSGESVLKNILETDMESNMLGEVALVDKNSKINKTNILFYETLFDENATCHIAVGCGFKECLIDSKKMNKKALEEIGYNKSKNHIDIMIGTNDLCIRAITYDDKEIIIFKDGSFNI